MDSSEVKTSGVYALHVEGQLVGEFVPGPIWSDIYRFAQGAYTDVTCEWRPFK